MKLVVVMTVMLKLGSDTASDLYLDVNRKANRYIRTEVDQKKTDHRDDIR